MDALRDYDIEFIKLKIGDHQFEYHLTDKFFKTFNSSLSAQDIKVTLMFRRSNSMFTLEFEIDGTINVECDRCLSLMQLPVKDKHTVLVKISDFPMENEDDLIYLSTHDYKINIAQHLYDFVNLSIPIKKTCSDIGRICDETVTRKITSTIDIETVSSKIADRDTDDEEEPI